MKKLIFAKMGKNVSFTQKWVKIQSNFQIVLKRIKKGFLAKIGKNVSFIQEWVKN